MALAFPGHVVATGSTDSASVLAIQKQLNRLGCGPIPEDSAFVAATAAAVELFQARSVDSAGHTLSVDGKVGPATWGALFGHDTVTPVTVAASALAQKVIAIAKAEVGTMEDPLGSNRGPRVDQYLTAAGLDPASGSFPWCAAFVYWCFDQAATSLGVANPATKTAGVHHLWDAAGDRGIPRVLAAEAADTPSKVQPGMVFVLSESSNTGHVGLVESVNGVLLTTIEGNTNDNGSREGIGVFERKVRHISQINLGFVNYA